MRIDLYPLRETIFNIIDILISPLRKFRIKLAEIGTKIEKSEL